MRTSPKRKAEALTESSSQEIRTSQSPSGNYAIETGDNSYPRREQCTEENGELPEVYIVEKVPSLKKRCIQVIRSTQNNITTSILTQIVTHNKSIQSLAQDSDFKGLSNYVSQFNTLDLSENIDEALYDQIEQFFRLNSPKRNPVLFKALFETCAATSSDTTPTNTEATAIIPVMNNLFLDNIRLRLLKAEFNFLSECLERNIAFKPCGNWDSDAPKLKRLCEFYQDLDSAKNNVLQGQLWLSSYLQRRYTEERHAAKPGVETISDEKEIERAERKLQKVKEKLCNAWNTFRRTSYLPRLSYYEGEAKLNNQKLYETLNALCQE